VAVSRREWRTAGHTGDLDRPLSPGGHAQAAALAELLGCFPPARVVSSSARRCLDTVRPYAAAMGVAAEGEEAFSLEGAGRPESVSGHPRSTAAVARLRALVSAGRPVVICAHRQNLPGLLAAACDQLGAAVPPGPPLSKGAFWVLHVAAGQLAGAEQHQVGGEEREASLARP
jgi:8-oxo-dGTP diphosphatase